MNDNDSFITLTLLVQLIGTKGSGTKTSLRDRFLFGAFQETHDPAQGERKEISVDGKSWFIKVTGISQKDSLLNIYMCVCVLSCYLLCDEQT